MQGHACSPGIDERGGGVVYFGLGGSAAENFEILMPQESFWSNLRLDARLETIKWPFLD